MEKSIINAKAISLNSEKFTKKLIKSRKPFYNPTKTTINEIVLDPIQFLQNYVDNNKWDNITFLIITFNFTLLKNYLINLLPNTDSYEISNNIIKSITQLVNPTGKLLNFSSDKYLLLYKIKKGKTSGIILHQINLAISSFFNISNSLPSIDAEIKSFQLDSFISAEKMLEGII